MGRASEGPAERRMSERQKWLRVWQSMEFLRGATAVLAHMKAAGEGGSTLYNEVVRFIGADSLIGQARRDGVMRWSGLDEYQRTRRHKGEHP